MFDQSHKARAGIGSDGVHLDALSSTNDYLKNLAARTEVPHGFYVSTDYQTSGRGQVGNRWVSDTGENILLSLLLKPPGLTLDQYFLLNMSVCLSIVDSLNHLHQGFLIKWPNDILFDGQKIAGVLIENQISGNNLRQAIVGIGINVNQRNLPTEFVPPPISMRRIMGRDIDRAYLGDLLFQRMNERYDQLLSQPAVVASQYHQHLYGFQQTIRARVGGQDGELRIKKVAADGTLQTQWQGAERNFQFKEVSFLF